MSESGTVLLSDFYLVNVKKELQISELDLDHIHYMPPDHLIPDESPTTAGDCFSFASVSFEVKFFPFTPFVSYHLIPKTGPVENSTFRHLCLKCRRCRGIAQLGTSIHLSIETYPWAASTGRRALGLDVSMLGYQPQISSKNVGYKCDVAGITFPGPSSRQPHGNEVLT